MNIVDVIIILFILLGGFVGFKRGLTTQIVSTFGIIVILTISFLLKNPISNILYTYLPFFDFGGLLKGISVLNIAVYELIAFLIAFSILFIIFKLLLKFTKIFEKILKYTLILGFPSKIAGAVVGLIEHYILAFIILYIASLPFFNINIKSDYKDKILNSTPLLSGFIDDSIEVVNKFAELKDKYENEDNANEFNKETLDLFLKYDVVNVKSVESLIKKDKLKIKNVNEILDKYRGK